MQCVNLVWILIQTKQLSKTFYKTQGNLNMYNTWKIDHIKELLIFLDAIMVLWLCQQ